MLVDVISDVEGRVLDPVRVVKPERHAHDPLPVHGQAIDAAGDHRSNVRRP
jgi:hypothetical protein